MKQYYTLVAGLRELTTGADAWQGFDGEALYGEVRRELGPRDRRAAGLLWSLAGMYGLERGRIEQLYGLCERSSCGWLRDWARFDRALRSVVSGGQPEGEFEEGERLRAALAGGNMIDKERAIDQIRWEHADGLTEASGDVFGAPTILAWLVKIGIIGRWARLDPVVGRQMYERLVSGLKSEN